MKTVKPGFTIVELLIVVVVIAILAAITIVSYNGVINRAHDASLKSDMQTAITSLEKTNILEGSYPADLASSNLQASAGNVFQYTRTGDAYCLTGTYKDIAYKASSANPSITAGVCPEHIINGGVVATFAGSGTAGFADGAGASAQFNTPYGVAVDTSGTIYVADATNHRIRKITPAGVVSTLAGSGTAGFADGAGASAQFRNPDSVAVDASGTVYVGDSVDNRIRKITPAGVVSTLAGSGTAGFAEGAGASAQFSYPIGVAVDSAGSVYVADYNNQRIRKITPAGVVSTLAGSGTAGFAEGAGASAKFSSPNGLTIDSSGVLYVADAANHRIRKVTSTGTVSTYAGSGTAGFANGTGASAQFNYPAGVIMSTSGTLYVTDAANQRIRSITAAGVVSTLAGSGTAGFANGTGASAKFNYPYSIATNNAGIIYVIDPTSHRIRTIQ